VGPDDRGHPDSADPWLDERQQRSWRTFTLMQEQLRSRIEQGLQRRSGLSYADYAVLSALADCEQHALRAFDLGRALGWEKSRLHHQLTRMQKRGLIERRTPTGSRNSRWVEVALTDDGLDAIQKAARSHVQEVRTLVIDALSERQLSQLDSASQRILDRLDEIPCADDSGG
jgi:DNA-binding MarR family transcriptional regulator